ncbi:MAG: sigma 54-interacting transcriptional regulator [Planctomycetota bacterium]
MQTHEQEIDTLEQISRVLGDSSELSLVFQRAMTLMSERMPIERASLVVIDPVHERLQIIASVGLSQAEQDRGRYEIGEGVTGRVIETGEAAVIPDLAESAEFLNRTRSRRLDPSETGEANPLSFVCLPIRDGDATVGAIAIDLLYRGDEPLTAHVRLIKIIAGLFAQTLRIHNRVQVEKDRWVEETQQLRENLHSRYRFDNIIGSSRAMLDVLATIGQVAASRATVLLLGETGAGKELIAKAIHYNSPRRDAPLIRVNCGALSPQLLESELFGHVKGAFTGAVRDTVGRFEAANGGSLFLDEIGTLDAQLQVKLLRALQEREFEKVGDHRSIKVDARVIAATNLDLEEEVRKGNFREDLYYRLNVVTVHLPSLRNRREDIPLLIDYFLDRYNRENDRSLSKISRDVMNTLLRYPWPGNVRELENAVERAVVLSTSDELTHDLLPLNIRLFAQQTRSDPQDESMDAMAARLAAEAIKQHGLREGEVYDLVIGEVERHLLREALNHNDGVKVRTADFLGINRNTLNKKVKDLGLDEAV